MKLDRDAVFEALMDHIEASRSSTLLRSYSCRNTADRLRTAQDLCDTLFMPVLERMK